MILGTEGTIELRKFVDIGTDHMGNQLYLMDKRQEVRIDAAGSVGTRFFGQLIRDCLEPHRNSDDTGTRIQGGRTLPALAG